MLPGNYGSSGNLLTQYRFWLDPLHAVVYFVACGFLLTAAFVKPDDESPYSYKYSQIQWFIVPTIGLSTLTWGLIWYGGLRLVMYRRMKELVVTRTCLVVADNEVEGQFIQKAEIVQHEWHVKMPSSGASLYDHEMNQR